MTVAEFHRQQAASMSEETLQREVMAIARGLGWLVTHFRPAKMQSGKWATPLAGDKGWPDLALCHPRWGRFMVRELKAQKGRLSPEQVAWLEALNAAGIDATVWRPEHLADGTILTALSTMHSTHDDVMSSA